MKHGMITVVGLMGFLTHCGGPPHPTAVPTHLPAVSPASTGGGDENQPSVSVSETPPSETPASEALASGTDTSTETISQDTASKSATDEAPIAPKKTPHSPPPKKSSADEVKEASAACITDKNIVISGKVLFETGKAKLKKVSFPVLDDVVLAMEKHPEIVKLQVAGHTDSDGDANANKRLSKRRATAVMKYLIKKGIEKDRLSAIGVGEDAPLVSNDTEEGKDKNRRVEFIIVERAKIRAVTHSTSTVNTGRVDSRSASDDETEKLIKKEGLDKKSW